MSDGSKIILNEKDVIDTSVIYPNEHFTYLGRTYVKKVNHDFATEDDGVTPKYEKKILPDGHLVNTVQVKGKEWEEFFELEIVKTDSPEVLKQFGRPMTTQIIPHGPKKPMDIFKYDGEQIRYENFDLKDIILAKKGNKIVRISGEVRNSRHSKELGYVK